MRARNFPARLSAGAFILNSGIGKLKADEQMAAQIHGMATGTYPFLSKLEPERFTKMLAYGEIVVGTLLLAPMVPDRVAGAGLTAFAGGLIGLYLRTPGMRQDGTLRPTQQGTAIAKDSWLLGMGLTLLLSV
ncbi:MAG: rane protein [Acidimicrobiaceae bacterium]|nr:rane protein [Acidimicrobiaceae bacterium]